MVQQRIALLWGPGAYGVYKCKNAKKISGSIVLSRKVDCDVCERVAKLKITLKLAVAPSSLNTLLKNVPVLSEAFLK